MIAPINYEIQILSVGNSYFNVVFKEISFR